jgi:hypothetical protein
MVHPIAAAVDLICARLEVESPREISLEELTKVDPTRPMYRARGTSRWTYVDRSLAILLRERGATWNGDVSRDPCAVA